VLKNANNLLLRCTAWMPGKNREEEIETIVYELFPDPEAIKGLKFSLI
jgi:hypothetical protein